MMYKMFADESEWDIFQNVIQFDEEVYSKSKVERELFKKITKSNWIDNTGARPDFLSDEIMIEMFEIDDIVTTKKGKNNPQRKSDARALREVQEWIANFSEGTFHENLMITARGDTRYNPESDSFTPDNSVDHHNYQAYLNNFKRICQKHLNSVEAYRENYSDKKLGFLIVDESTFYVTEKQTQSKRILLRDAFWNYPIFDKNFMRLFIKSKVDFIIWAFNNKYFYTEQDPHGLSTPLPKVVILTKDNFYDKYSKYFEVEYMISLEE